MSVSPDTKAPVPRHEILGAGAFVASSIFGLLQPALLDAGYAFASLESLLIISCALIGGAAAGMLRAASRASWLLVAGLLVYIVLDFYAFKRVEVAAGAALVVMLLLATRALEAMRTAATVAFLAFPLLIASTTNRDLVAPSLPKILPVAQSTAPPVLHLVLDEHASLEMLRTTPEGFRLAAEIQEGYLTRGFRIFDSTRATSGATQESLARAMALGPRSAPITLVEKGGEFEFRLLQNRYFDLLRRSGRDLLVLQSSFLELCRAAEIGCHTYSRAGHPATAIAMGLPMKQRFYLLPLLFHYQMIDRESTRYVSLYDNTVGYRVSAPKREHWMRPAAVLGVIESLQRTVAGSDLRGHVVFAHLLLPHFPYMLDSHCRSVPQAQWRSPGWRERSSNNYGRSRDKAYVDQARCLHGRVWALVDSFLSQPGSETAIVVIHGDHGARPIQKTMRMDEATVAETAANATLDTFFAVKSPQHQSGVVKGRQTLDARFEREIYLALGLFAPSD